MKCYACGQSNDNHLINCPKFKKTWYGQRIEKKSESAIDKVKKIVDIDNNYSKDFEDFTVQQRKTWKSFLPLELQGGTTVPSGGIAIACGQPHIACRPYRLWINELIAPTFSILGIFLGVSAQIIAPGTLPANLFRTGRWPIIKSKKDLYGNTILEPYTDWEALEYGIDLSSWKTISPAQKVSIQIENIGSQYSRFDAVLEVTCLSDD